MLNTRNIRKEMHFFLKHNDTSHTHTHTHTHTYTYTHTHTHKISNKGPSVKFKLKTKGNKLKGLALILQPYIQS